LVEWPDKLGDLIPENALQIDISFDGDGRKVTLTGFKEIT
jgi:tRNA A37 threonylcarbamoyladenosine biosynthesis protein TsaE